MRTTISLPDKLLQAAKRRAQERETTLSAVVADALQLALNRREEARHRDRFSLVTFRGDGTLPGVDLTRSSELYEVDDVDVLRVSDASGRGHRLPNTRSPSRKRGGKHR